MAQIKITADTQQAQASIENLRSALKTLESASSTIGRALGALTAAGAGVAVAFKLVVDQVGDLADLGKALGMTAQGLGYLQKSAQLAGIEAGELNAALFRLRGNIGEALVKGSGAAGDAIKRLGLNLADLSTQDAGQQIATVTAALQTIPNPAERSALAIDLLGKQGPRLLEVAENAARLAREAKLLGIALSDIDVRNLEVAGDALDELAFIAKGAVTAAMAELAPYIIAIAEALKTAALEGGGIGQVIRTSVLPALKLATQAAAILIALFTAVKLTAGLVAASTAALTLYSAIKTAAGAAAVLNAILGKNPLLKIAGAVVGLIGAAVAVKEIGDAFDQLDRDAEAVRARTTSALSEEEAQRKKIVAQVAQLNQEQRKALDSLSDTVTKLQLSAQFQADVLSLGTTEATIRKTIAEEQEKLLKSQVLSTAEGRKAFEVAQQQIRAAIEQEAVIKQQAATQKVIEGLQTEQLGLTIADKNQREIVLAIRARELESGREMSQVERARLTDTIAVTQALREQAGIRDAINTHTREQTQLEKVNRAISLQGTVDPQGTASRNYERDQAALATALETKLISEAQYFEQRAVLEAQFQSRQLEMQNTEFQNFNRLNEQKIQADANRHAAALRNETDFLGGKRFSENTIKQIAQDRAAFMNKTEMEQAQFAIQQGATIFSALGAQNKKAFEAAKAFNIANAIMNTYMGATKALATYPFPFGLIAAAAAVAAGMAQVAQIRSQQYSGRQLGGPVMAGRSYMVGEAGPELFTPTNTGAITRNQDLGDRGAVTVNFSIVANDTQGFDTLLTSRKGVIQQIISDAMLERGQRSMV